MVHALTSVFWVADSEQIQILLATIPAPTTHGPEAAQNPQQVTTSLASTGLDTP